MGRGRFFRKRSPATLEPRRKFYIFCEGSNTEPGYFHALRRKYRKALIEILPERGVGVPSSVAKEAIAQIQKARKNSFEDRDQVWAVFDRDDHPCYDKAIGDCEASGVQVGRSNPCFELWLILHEQDFDKDVHRDKVASHLGKIRTDWDGQKKVLDFDEIIEKIESAEKRAVKQMKARIAEKAKRLGPPYTTVGRLTLEIRNAVTNDMKK